MNKKIFILLISLCTIVSCHNGDNHEGHNHEKEEHNHAENKENHKDGTISFCDHKAKEIGIIADTIRYQSFNRIIKVGGEIYSQQQDEKTIVASVSGIVSFKKDIVEGKKVRDKEQLLSLSSENILNGNFTQKSKIDFEIIKKEYQRVLKLRKKKIVSEKDFAPIKQKFETARLRYDALKKGEFENGQIIVSPINGYIKEVLVNEGEYVEVGQPLMVVSTNNKLYLKADVPAEYYPLLKEVNSANFKTSYDNKVYQLEELNGKLLAYGKAINKENFYIPVTFSFDARSTILPGSFAEVFLMSTEINDAIAIPEEAIIEEENHLFVFKKIAPETYVKKEITIGNNNGKEVEVLSGIYNGDCVVTHKAFILKLATATQSIPAHSHHH